MTSTLESRLGIVPLEGMKSPVVTHTTENITLSGHQLCNEVLTTDRDRVLVAVQTDATENGIYLAYSGAWVRAADWNANDDIVNGQVVLDTSDGLLYRIIISGAFTLGTTEVSIGLLNGSTLTVKTGYAGTAGTYASGSSFTVGGTDVTESLTQGTVVQFMDEGTIKYGTVSTSTFDTDTTLSLTMLDGTTISGDWDGTYYVVNAITDGCDLSSVDLELTGPGLTISLGDATSIFFVDGNNAASYPIGKTLQIDDGGVIKFCTVTLSTNNGGQTYIRTTGDKVNTSGEVNTIIARWAGTPNFLTSSQVYTETGRTQTTTEITDSNGDTHTYTSIDQVVLREAGGAVMVLNFTND